MMRTGWVALVFLIGTSALAAVKLSIATPVKHQTAFTETTVGVSASQSPLSKADKLDVSFVDEAPDKKVVRLIPIVLPNSAQPEPREKVNKIINRHWHEGDAKITKRSASNRRVASLKKAQNR
jgi:hypothetical protein